MKTASKTVRVIPYGRLAGIPGLSDKQLRRIECGESRLTSNAAKKLAKAHGMTSNGYLQKVSEALGE
jgi:hypothetical protein